MSTQDSRVPLPCRYFHTPQGCPYGKWCKYDHYSNNPSYFNYIKQRLHQISKPQKSNDHNQNMVHMIVESVQRCITDIIHKEFHSLYQEISALKSTIDRQNKWIQTKNTKQLSESVFTKHIHKITKLLKQNHTAIQTNKDPPNTPKNVDQMSDHEWNNIFTKIRTQLTELQADKRLFETQVTSTVSTSKPHTITKLAPPPDRSSIKRTRTKRMRKRDPSPFDNMTQYDNVFEAITPTPITMDQISALPIPPKRKPNPIKRNIKRTKETHVVAMTSVPRKPLVVKNKKRKMKRNPNKPYIRRKQPRSKKKQNQMNKDRSMLPGHNVKNARVRTPMVPFNFMCDTDFYQIVRSDSSEDESNMTREDVAKLDMLDSI
eukprot:446933_1